MHFYIFTQKTMLPPLDKPQGNYYIDDVTQRRRLKNKN